MTTKECKWGVKIIHFNLKTNENFHHVEYEFEEEEESLDFFDSLDLYGMNIS